MKTLRNAVRTTMGEAGWKIGRARSGKVFLQHVELRPRGETSPTTTVSLPYSWSEASVPDVIGRCRAIAAVIGRDGCDLKTAASVAAGASSHQQEDWGEAVVAFERHKTTVGRRVSQSTWDRFYRPALEKALEILEGPRPPRTGLELMEELALGWEPGSRQRSLRVRHLAAFLRFAVERQQFRKCWAPPASANVVLGEEDAAAVPYPLTDEMILELMDSLQGQPERQFTIALLSVYGLRPNDLHFLKVRKGELWSDYRKKAGKGKPTEPRRLAPLFVAGQDWKLLERFEAGEPLCDIGEKGKTSYALRSFLQCNPVWVRLKQEAADKGEKLVPYGFRHRYVAEGQLRSIPPKVLAAFLGHSLQTHLIAYSRWNVRDNACDYFD